MRSFDYLFDLKGNSKSHNHFFNFDSFFLDSAWCISTTISFIIDNLPNDEGYSSEWCNILTFAIGDILDNYVSDEKIYVEHFTYANIIAQDMKKILEDILKNKKLVTKRMKDSFELIRNITSYISDYTTALCNMQNYNKNGIEFFITLWNTFKKYEKNDVLARDGKITLLLNTTDKLLTDELLKDENSLIGSECLSVMAGKFLELYFKFGKSFEKIINTLNFEKRKAIAMLILFRNNLPEDAKEYFKKFLQNEEQT